MQINQLLLKTTGDCEVRAAVDMLSEAGSQCHEGIVSISEGEKR